MLVLNSAKLKKCVELIKQSKHGFNLYANHLYALPNGQFLVFNKSKNILRFVSDKHDYFFSQEQYVILNEKPEWVDRVEHKIEAGAVETAYVPITITETPLPEQLRHELSENTINDPDYMFGIPLSEEFVKLVTLLPHGDGLQIYYNENMLNKIQCAEYDPINFVLKTNCWTLALEIMTKAKKKITDTDVEVARKARHSVMDLIEDLQDRIVYHGDNYNLSKIQSEIILLIQRIDLKEFDKTSI